MLSARSVIGILLNVNEHLNVFVEKFKVKVYSDKIKSKSGRVPSEEFHSDKVFQRYRYSGYTAACIHFSCSSGFVLQMPLPV